MCNDEIKDKISKIVLDAKWNNRIESWYHFANVISQSVEGGIVSFSHETIRKMARKGTIPKYHKWMVLYDHSNQEWIRNMAREIMRLLRPELWRGE